MSKVYIWYPNGRNMGHASMHIGNHSEDNNCQYYVSWWADRFNEWGAGATILHPTTAKNYQTMKTDMTSEGSAATPEPPHAIYTLTLNLDENNMKTTWDSIKSKPGAHYKLYGKNCATIVARVLRAGGADKPLNLMQRNSYAHNLYWTPKNIAEWCNLLRDIGMASKIKSTRCPTKSSNIGAVIAGLR